MKRTELEPTGQKFNTVLIWRGRGQGRGQGQGQGQGVLVANGQKKSASLATDAF